MFIFETAGENQFWFWCATIIKVDFVVAKKLPF